MNTMKEADPLVKTDLEQIYNQYFSKIFQTCYQYVKNREDAFDWTQDIMIKISDAIPGFAGRSSISTWIFSISRNYCLTQMYRLGRIRFSDISMVDGLAYEDSDPDAFEERKRKEEEEQNLTSYLEHLPEHDKRFLELKYFRNYSIKDLQEEFELSASAVKMRLLRARQKAGLVCGTRPAA